MGTNNEELLHSFSFSEERKIARNFAILLWLPFSLVLTTYLSRCTYFVHLSDRKMQHDDMIWQIINNEFCSFKAKLRMEKQTFCRNPYNVTGLCSRRNCPLANSRYATVREEKGKVFLYVLCIQLITVLDV